MLLLVALGGLVLAGPGPLDAFNANHAAIKARVKFTHEAGPIRSDVLTSGDIWKPGDHGLRKDPMMSVVGRWECDGRADHTVCRPTPEAAVLLKATTSPDGRHRLGRPPIEVLTDGELTAFLVLEGRDRVIQATRGEEAGRLDFGPFHYFLNHFPDIIKSQFAGSTLTRGVATRDGHPCEVEVYRITKEKLWAQLEISYDPSIGYLPRFARIISYDPGAAAGGRAYVGEMYLTRAQACSTGGFVPLEWTTVNIDVDGFDRSYPDYSYATVLRPPEKEVYCWHYDTASFQDAPKIRDICMEELDGVVGVQGVGGFVPLKGLHKDLSLAGIKRLLGSRLTERKATVFPNIDAAELSEPLSGSRRGEWIAPVVLGALAILALFLARRRRAMGLLFLLALASSPGCGTTTRPIMHLAGAFTPTRLIYDPRQPAIPLSLTIRNEGNVSLKIFDLNSGCTCREVDRKSFPRELTRARTCRWA